MCLSYQTEFPVKIQKDGYIQLWKVVSRDNNTGLYPHTIPERLSIGENKAHCKLIKDDDWTYYTSGFHCFLLRKDARLWNILDYAQGNKIIKVFVKPEDINAKGVQYDFYNKKGAEVVVVSKMTIKSFKSM